MLDGLSAAAARVALGLDLLIHPWGQHVLLKQDPPAAAHVTRLHHAVRGPGALALLADVLLVPLEFRRRPVVEVPKRDLYLDLDVVAPSLARVAEVPAPAEEPAEQVEGVMVMGPAALLVLLEALVAVLIVDAT